MRENLRERERRQSNGTNYLGLETNFVNLSNININMSKGFSLSIIH
jgi:hypothetical protein